MKTNFSVLILMIIGHLSFAQCGFMTSSLVPDEESDNFIVSVSGLTNNDLSNPGQGVCGITLNFEHNSIGDWEAVLTSPSGQSINLIGPVGLFGETEYTTWNISFIPCAEVANPDLGFVQTWDSDQAWGTGNNFVGSYYPNSGCLEDFNMGPANGSWTLFISDNNSIDEGSLLGFSLIFCSENVQQACFLCTPDGGRITGTVAPACEGDPSLNLNLTPTYTGPGPDPTIYDYTYVIVLGNIIQQVSNPADLTALPEGNYRIFGLSYLRSDQGNLPTVGNSFSGFRADLSSASPVICGDLSANSRNIEIFDRPTPTFLFDTICFGDAYMIGDSTFTTPGIKTLDFQTINSCDSSVILNLAVINVATDLLGPNELNCLATTAQITFNGIPLAELDSIIWFNATATFFNDDFVDNVTVNEAGEYFAAFSFRGCVDTLSKVIGDANLPSLDLISDTLICTRRSGRIQAISSANVTYAWTFNSLPFSNLPNPIVTEGGIYRVTIEEIGSGCQNNGSVRVLMDTLPPPVNIVGGSLSCTTTSINLEVLTRPGSTVLWSGPNFFTSNSLTPAVTLPGLYTVTVTAVNDCTNRGNVTVDNTVPIFGLSVELDSISCVDLTADVSFTSTLGNLTSTWTSPSSQTFNGPFQSFTEPGIYRLDLVNSDMCDTTAFVEIVADTLPANIQILGGTELNCLNESLIINAISDPINAQLEWLFPDNTTSDQNDITATLAGNYQITATTINGCVAMDTIEITYAVDLPDPMTIIDTFDCETDTVTLRATNVPNFGYQWNDGSMDLGTDPDQRVTQPGYHYLTVTDIATGCEAQYAYDIPIDLTFTPAQLLARDTINCLDSVLMLAPITINTALSFSWTRNGRAFSMDSLIEVREGGNYRVNIRYSSLCDETLISRISVDTVLSTLNLAPFDSLTCTNQFVDLEATSPDNVDYNWFFDDIFLVNDSIISVTVPGNYVVQATAPNHCISVDTALVVQDTMAPIFSIQGDTINCATSKVNLSVIDPLDTWMFEWSGPNAFMSDDSTVLVRDTGLYSVTVTSLNGCTSRNAFSVIGDFELPESMAFGGSLNCIDSSLELIGTSATTDASLVWFGPSGFTTNDATPIVFDTGTYVLLTTGTNGCSIKDTVTVDDMPPSPDAQITLGLWDCSTIDLPVEASSLDTGVVYDWVGPNGFTFNGASPVIPSFGDYMITYTGVNGCITVIDTFIPTDTLRPIVDVFTNQPFRCEQRIITLLGENSDQGPEFSYLWTTTEGQILSDVNALNAVIGDTGIYTLQVTNERNHCINSADFDVVETPSDLFFVFFTKEDYGCLNGYSGQVIVDSVVGGGLPILFSFDQEPFVPNTVWNHLLPGDYTVELRDTFGCRLDTGFAILDSLYLNLSITQDTTIKLGDSILLSPEITDLIDITDAQFSWSPSVHLSCTDCSQPIANPTVTTRYCVEVSTESGCLSTACILVRVEEDNIVYVPNAFTPNADDINDRLIPLTTKDVVSIDVFQIFDRWGNMVHSEQNQNPSSIIGWDGSFNGVELTSQVFVYRLVYTTLSNKIINQTGDITLLR